MNNDIVKIKIAGIPGIFPDKDYQGRIGTYLRVILLGNYSETVVTEKTFRTIYDNNYQERMVQSIVYNKYKIRIMANEYLRADFIPFAKYGYVTTHDGTQHKMKFLNITYNKEDGTELGTYEIEYADINPKNYKNQNIPISNYLEHNQLQEEFTTSQLVALTMTDTGTTPFATTMDNEFFGIVNTPIGGTPENIFYTEILPEEVVTDISEDAEEVNAVEKVTRSYGGRAAEVRFYLKTTEKNILAKYLQRCDTVTLTDPSGVRTATERVVPDIKPVGVDLFQVDIIFKYETFDYYPENIN